MVTGHKGFIGSEFVRLALNEGYFVLGVDKETYAANLDNHFPEYGITRYGLDLSILAHDFGSGGIPKKYKSIKEDICNLKHMPDVDFVVNFAAETHVDNSITDSKKFVESNVLGVQNLLELVRGKRNYQMPVFIQISTDEVYGECPNSAFTEDAPLNPGNPYSASKASADLLVQSYARTYGLKYNIIRPTNNYGPHQYPEKLIPKTIKHFSLGKPMPIHGSGHSSRTWLHIKDTARAVLFVIENGFRNQVYNVGGTYEAQNIEVVKRIYDIMSGKKLISKAFTELVEFNYTRPGEDARYSLNSDKIHKLGWMPKYLFECELENIIKEKVDYLW